MWNKYPEVKPSGGQKVLCLIWGTDIFPATFIESSNGKHRGWFPEVDCISVAGDLVGRMDPVNPCFEGDVDYWMEYPALPDDLVRDSYKLPPEPRTCETCACGPLPGGVPCSDWRPKKLASPHPVSTEDVITIRSALNALSEIRRDIQALEQYEEWSGGSPNYGTCRTFGRIKDIANNSSKALEALDRIAGKNGR